MQRGTQESAYQMPPTLSTHPALHPRVTSVPVTPGVHTEGKSAYFEADREEHEDESETVPENEQATPGPQWNANSYFPTKEQEEEDRSKAEEAVDPRQPPTGAQTGEELLSRLNRTGKQGAKKDLADVDPRA
ncbi:hypothetical protein LTS18_012372, partial [Coniosporium uncinatum]